MKTDGFVFYRQWRDEPVEGIEYIIKSPIIDYSKLMEQFLEEHGELGEDQEITYTHATIIVNKKNKNENSSN